MSLLGLIHVPYWGHATLLEVMWLASGFAATMLTALNLQDSWKDKALLETIRTDPSIHDLHYRMISVSARGRLNSQLTRLSTSLLIVATGLVGVYQANPLGGGTTWTGLTVTGCLVAISVLTAGRSYFDLRQRNNLYDMALQRTPVITARLRSRNITPDQEEK